jgi:hypothetical protein
MENRWQVVKRYTNRVLDRSGAPAIMWLYAMLLVIFCINNIVDPNLACGTQSPIAFSTGNLNDISPLLREAFQAQKKNAVGMLEFLKILDTL